MTQHHVQLEQQQEYYDAYSTPVLLLLGACCGWYNISLARGCAWKRKRNIGAILAVVMIVVIFKMARCTTAAARASRAVLVVVVLYDC